MKLLIIPILILGGLNLKAQTDSLKSIDSVASAIDLSRSIFSIDSGTVQLTPNGKYAKYEIAQYDILANKQLGYVNYFRVYVDRENFVAEGNPYSGWYRDFIDFWYSNDQLVKITHNVGVGLVDSTFLMLQKHQYYFDKGKLIHKVNDYYGNNYSNYITVSSDTLYQMGKVYLDNYKKQLR